jgi:ABC-type multidrug transport system fused ATPase/permease subunit
MPLSPEEQRILREIEANLTATDPALVQQVSETTLYRHAARSIKWALVGFVGGLALMLVTFWRMLPLGVAGFLTMLVSLLVIERNVRKLGRAGLEQVTRSLPGGSFRQFWGGRAARWRQRWRRDDA